MTDPQRLIRLSPDLDGWRLEVREKQIRHIYFRIYGESKTVAVSAPAGITTALLRRAVQSKLGWIKNQIRSYENRQTLPLFSFQTGERHYFQGKMYPIAVKETGTRQGVEMSGTGELLMFVKPGTGPEKRERLLETWYRTRLKESAGRLVTEWEPRVGVRVSELRVRKMRTRWGSCNTRAGRIWLNLALILLAPAFLEYVLVHEMIHILERYHNKRFYAHMDRLVPGWPDLKKQLNQFSF